MLLFVRAMPINENGLKNENPDPCLELDRSNNRKCDADLVTVESRVGLSYHVMHVPPIAELIASYLINILKVLGNIN